MSRKRVDISGRAFGRLVAIEFFAMSKNREATWRCRCACGALCVVSGSRLRGGHTTSCGCFKREALGLRSRKHGKSKTPAFMMYYDARKRARARGVPINIEPSDIIIPERCPVLGIPLVAGAGLKSGNTPTLDCIDPSKGYVRGNIEVVSWRFNKLKSDLTPDEMRRIAAWVLR